MTKAIALMEIIDRFESKNVDLQLLKNIIENYRLYPHYIIKYISVYYAKSTALCVVDHVINCKENRCDIMTCMLDSYNILLCDEHLLKHIVCKEKSGCVCTSRLCWYSMYSYFIDYITLEPTAFFNSHLNLAMITLISRTDAYDDRLVKFIEKLALTPKSWDNILKFIRDSELFGSKIGDIIFKIRDKLLKNDKLIESAKDPNISGFKNRVLLGHVLQTYNNIHKNISKITDNLYISDITIPKNISIVKDKQIHCVVSLTKKEIFKIANIEYIHIMIDDIGSVDFIKATIESSKKIAKYVKQNKNVLVHCFKGLSRSVCFVILVLINNGMTFDEAYEHVKKHKTRIDPNPDFINQITQYIEKIQQTK